MGGGASAYALAFGVDTMDGFDLMLNQFAFPTKPENAANWLAFPRTV